MGSVEVATDFFVFFVFLSHKLKIIYCETGELLSTIDSSIVDVGLSDFSTLRILPLSWPLVLKDEKMQ